MKSQSINDAQIVAARKFCILFFNFLSLLSLDVGRPSAFRVATISDRSASAESETDRIY